MAPVSLNLIKKYILALPLFLYITHGISQESLPAIHQLTLSGYADSYFASYSNALRQNEFQPFITVGARDNNFGLNIASLGIQYTHTFLRGNILLHYGDIPKATWSDDFQNIQEANIGLKLSDGLWVDAGFFATHI